MDGAGAGRPAPLSRHTVRPDAVLEFVQAVAEQRRQRDVGAADGDPAEETAEGAGVAGGVVGLLVEADLAVGPGEKDFRPDGGHGRVGQNLLGGVQPSGVAPGVVVQEGHDVTARPFDTAVDPGREADVGRQPDHGRPEAAPDRRGGLARGAVVDEDHLVGGLQRRFETPAEPGLVGVAHDDDRTGHGRHLPYRTALRCRRKSA